MLVVDGDPRTVRTEDETFFLEAALRAGGCGFSLTTVCPTTSATATPDLRRGLPGQRRQADRGGRGALIRYVEAGGGLFVSVGNRVDADAWNETLKARAAAAAGAAAHRRRPARRPPGVRPSTCAPPSAWRRSIAVTRCWPASPPRATAWRRRASSSSCCWHPAGRPGRSVVLRYESGAPALVDAEVGHGRVLLLTTTVDREWTDLPIRPGFLPLMQEAARYLAGAPRARRPPRSSGGSARSRWAPRTGASRSSSRAARRAG